ncbi:MAG: ATP phosphoribosyltransferase regulatory subunit [Pseudomonadota bacterium]
MAGGRIGDDLARLSALRDRVLQGFVRAGAARVEPETLQPADLLLDLYGEDIRARAFLVHDPVEGELVLRPDFTVPVTRLHMSDGGDAARYAYEGLIWRRQDPGSIRPTEYLQAGLELFGGTDPAEDEAEVFVLIRDALCGVEARPLTGDLGIIFAAIDALATSERRRAALRRHVWRPARFKALLDRFAAAAVPSAPRGALLSADDGTRRETIRAAGKVVGMRSPEDVAARLLVLSEDQSLGPIAPADKAMIEAVLAVKGPSVEALRDLRAMDLAAMAPALDKLEHRLAALSARGVDAENLPFDATFGRGLEYYDGFVFELRSPDPALPPLGGGGRYDALTSILGGGIGSTAVGGIVRPEAVLAAGGQA